MAYSKKKKGNPNKSFFKVLFFVLGLFCILIINVGVKPIVEKYLGSYPPLVPIGIGILGLTLLVYLGRKKL